MWMADTFISKVFINNPQYLILDIPRKTATGTIAIQVEDFNDNCPTLTSTNQTVCFQENVVYVTAVDGDAYPNGAPFEFKVVSNTKEEWSVERLNGEYLHRVTDRSFITLGMNSQRYLRENKLSSALLKMAF